MENQSIILPNELKSINNPEIKKIYQQDYQIFRFLNYQLLLNPKYHYFVTIDSNQKIEVIGVHNVALDEIITKDDTQYYLEFRDDQWNINLVSEVIQKCSLCFQYFYLKNKKCQTCYSRKIMVDQSFLLLPIKNNQSDPNDVLKIYDSDGKIFHKIDIYLSYDQKSIDWWAHLDLSSHLNQTITLVIVADANHSGLKMIKMGSQHPNNYHQKLRPQLRFSQSCGWNNDPNGLVYHQGEYHFFWQSNPVGNQWANMYWGHAVSTDLLHWEELPLALYPRVMAKGLCFSGSANVVKDNNQIIIAFTDTQRGECLATSSDQGRTWKYLKQNPIIKHRGRDPKLIWYQPKKHWVIIVYEEREKKETSGFSFYISKDLIDWEFASHLEGFYECPELISLQLNNRPDPKYQRWVLFGADGKYLIGNFDGKSFTPIPDNQEKYQLHYGKFYASQCFNCLPNKRIIQIGWAQIPMPSMPFNQAFSLPIELKLKTTSLGHQRLFAEPIQELNSLRIQSPQIIKDHPLTINHPIIIPVKGQLFDVLVDLTILDSEIEIQLIFGENKLKLTNKLLNDDIPIELANTDNLKVRMIIDRPMYELSTGFTYYTEQRLDGGEDLQFIKLSALKGSAHLNSLTIYQMKSIWD